MNAQLKRWSRATAVVLGGIALVSSLPVWSAWRVVGAFGLDGSRADWGPLLTQLLWAGGEFLGCLLILVLATQIGDRLLGGRRRLVIGVALTLLAVVATEWFAFDGSASGLDELSYGIYSLVLTLSIPLAAGAWMLRSDTRTADPVADPLPFEGVWESARGVLSLEPEAAFTLLRAGGEAVAGVWQPENGELPVLTLKVAAPTALGQGWQTTLLEVEYGPDGRMLLRVDEGIAFTRRPETTEVEYAGGYVGQLEILES